MSGFMFCTGECVICKRLFTFNPVTVPSTSAFTGEREPICQPCITTINERRTAADRPLWPVAADAYTAAEVA